MGRRIFGDHQLINDFIKTLTKIEVLEDGWSIVYKDLNTNLSWLQYQIDSEYHGGGQSNLIRLPEPSFRELIDITLHSPFEDEVIAASIKLRDDEVFKGIEFRYVLIDLLEKKILRDLSQEDIKRLTNIIRFSELDSSLNRREILKKNIAEIDSDTTFFSEISKRADRLLNKIKKL